MRPPPSAPTNSVLIVDYGLGNLLSLSRAVEHIGARPYVSSNPADIVTASRIILPGVGSFSEASRSLHDGGFTEHIVSAAGNGVSILGICLGMQMLFDEGFENGVSPGLGLIPGTIRRILSGGETSLPRTHIGWRHLDVKPSKAEKENESRFPEGPFYFVHSYAAVASDPSITKATVYFGDVEIPAIVQRENVLGVQFHPEKSRFPGLKLLSDFCAISS